MKLNLFYKNVLIKFATFSVVKLSVIYLYVSTLVNYISLSYKYF
jgi:hypothetical protein